MTYIRLGNEFRVNSQTGLDQLQPEITALTNSGFVVTWQDQSGTLGDSSGLSIKAQMYDSSGAAVGSEFLVNAQTTGNQVSPGVTGLNGGGFVVTWTDASGISDGSFSGVEAQIFDATGSKIGTEFQVNTQTTSTQGSPSITRLTNGGFVIAWSDLIGTSIKAQVYDASGARIGGELLANTETTGSQNVPQVAGLSNGGFVITWEDDSATLGDSSQQSIKAQIFAATGAKIGTEFLVNTTTTGAQQSADVAGLTGGDFVISWRDDSNGLGDIRAQLFDATGTKVGTEFLVNTQVTSIQSNPSITALTDGGFVIAWTDFSAGINDANVKAQAFDLTGTKVGTEFLVNTQTTSHQTFPAVAGLGNGGFAIVWPDLSGTLGDSSGWSIKAQAYQQQNSPPVVNGSVALAAIDEDSGARLITQSQLLVNASDVDGPSLAAVNLQIAAGLGTLVDNANQTWSYTPVANDETSVTFSYQVTDGTTPVATTATLDINPMPETGTAADDSFTAPDGAQNFGGLGGIDTIMFGFRLVDATVTYDGNKVIIDGPSSHTVLTGFERYVFTDGTVDNNDGSPLIDDLFYYSRYHDVWNAHVDADAHYNSSGWHEWRDPSAFFSTSFYLAAYQDVKAAGVNPLTQFDQTGWKDGRIPSPAFDPGQYRSHYPDIAAANVDPLLHFLSNGAQEGRQPFAPAGLIAANGFDYIYYLQHNPDVLAAHVDPFVHFQTSGWREGRNPNAFFDTNGYLATYVDVKNAGVNPLDHYHLNGWIEGRDPSIPFDTADYFSHYPDVAAAHIDPLRHFLANGILEGRLAFNDGAWG